MAPRSPRGFNVGGGGTLPVFMSWPGRSGPAQRFNVGGGGTLPVWLALDASFDQGFCGDLRAVARGSLVWWVGFGCQGAQKSLIL